MPPPSSNMVEALPEECLMAIVETLDHTLQNLYPLLLSCRTLFRIGAEVMYRSPFELLDQDHRFVDGQERIARQRRLLRLLLSCLDESTLASLPPYHTNLISLPRQPTIDYLAFYSRHSSKNFDIALTLGPGASPAVMASAPSGAIGPLPTASLAVIRPAVHVALLSHTPSQIRTLVFSIRHIASLQPLATKLSALSRIELYMQVKAPLDGAICFIQTHRRAFPSTLNEIKLDVPSSMHPTGASGLVKLIQAMERPRLIDVRGWPGAVSMLSQFPAEECRVLLTRQGTNFLVSQHDQQDGQAPVTPLSKTIAAFSKLETLRLTIYEPNFFAWARKPSVDAGQLLLLSNKGCLIRHGTRSLKNVRLDGFDHDLIPSLEDVARNFEGTLESLGAISRFDARLPRYLKMIPTSSRDNHDDAAAAISAGMERLVWAWRLPQLHTIDLEGSVAIRFDYSSLQYCPALTRLRFNVGRRIPADWDCLHDAIVHIVQVPRLRELELAGYWSLTDDMLEKVLTPGLADRLQHLNLMWCSGPTTLGIEAVMRGIRTLLWLGLSTQTERERDELLSIQQIQDLFRLELDIRVAGK